MEQATPLAGETLLAYPQAHMLHLLYDMHKRAIHLQPVAVQQQHVADVRILASKCISFHHNAIACCCVAIPAAWLLPLIPCCDGSILVQLGKLACAT